MIAALTGGRTERGAAPAEGAVDALRPVSSPALRRFLWFLPRHLPHELLEKLMGMGDAPAVTADAGPPAGP